MGNKKPVLSADEASKANCSANISPDGVTTCEKDGSRDEFITPELPLSNDLLGEDKVIMASESFSEDAGELDDPNKVNRAARLKMLQNVETSLQSSNEGEILEGQVARRYENQLLSFNKKFGSNGSDGEIDVELPNVIIEVSIGLKKGKRARVQRKRLLGETLNPDQKPVVQFSKLKPKKRMISAQRQHLLDSGLYDVATSFDELDAIIETLHK